MTSLRALARFAFASGTALLAGCGSDGGDSEGPGVSGPRVVLGTGREAFEVLDSEGSVPLIKGIQGGFHVWTSFLAYGFETDVMRMELRTSWDTLAESTLEMAGNVAVRPSVDPQGSPALLSLGWPASIFNPACSNGRRVSIDITVRDTSSGLSASDSRHWVVDVNEEDRSLDCQ
jgi:hypothetical protein